MLGLGPDFTTTNFDVIATFKTRSPYQNNQNTALDITCDSTHNVAYLITDFSTESGYDFVTLTDTDADLRILSKSFYNKYEFHNDIKRGPVEQTCPIMKLIITSIITTLTTNQMKISFFASGSTPALHRSKFYSLRIAR